MSDAPAGKPHRAAVALHEVSADTYVRFTVAAMEAMEEVYPDAPGSQEGWPQKLFRDLDNLRGGTIVRILGHVLNGATADQVLESMTLEEVAVRMADALSLSLYGRKVAEQVAHRAKEMEAALEKRRAFEAKMEEARKEAGGA